MLFKIFLKESNKKPNKIWVDKGSEGKSVVAERFIRTLKTKIYKYMTSISNIINECNNTYHRTIKMKPVDVKDNKYIDFKKS